MALALQGHPAMGNPNESELCASGWDLTSNESDTIRLQVADAANQAMQNTVYGADHPTQTGELHPDGTRVLDPNLQGWHMARAILDVGFKFRTEAEPIARGNESVVFGLKDKPDIVVLYPADYTRLFWVSKTYPEAKALSDRISQLPDANYVMRIRSVEGSFPKNIPYMVVERAENGSVADMIAAKSGFQTLGPSNPKMVLKALLDMARGIRAIHSLGKVHGDIKPENILVDADLTFKVGDLTMITDGNTLPLSGFAATPEYCDQSRLLNGGRPTQQSDIYALGVLATEITFGRRVGELKKYGVVFEHRLRNGSTWHEIGKPGAEMEGAVSPILSNLAEALRRAKNIHEAIQLIENAESALKLESRTPLIR